VRFEMPTSRAGISTGMQRSLLARFPVSIGRAPAKSRSMSAISDASSEDLVSNGRQVLDGFLPSRKTVGEIGKGESSRRIGPGNTAIAAIVAKGERAAHCPHGRNETRIGAWTTQLKALRQADGLSGASVELPATRWNSGYFNAGRLKNAPTASHTFAEEHLIKHSHICRSSGDSGGGIDGAAHGTLVHKPCEKLPILPLIRP
jgi:hypothetical protein